MGLNFLSADARHSSGNIPVYVLCQPAARDTASAAPLSVQRHTVGRARHLADLRAGFESVSAGRVLLLCVAGEPGIGKTTLVEDFLDELQASSPCSIARGRCSERLAGAEAYLPILEALESVLRGEAGEPAARLMKLLAPTWYVQVAPFSDEDSSAARLSADVKIASQERIKREFSAFLQEISRIRPCVLFFDDVHWADVSTIDLLAYVMSKKCRKNKRGTECRSGGKMVAKCRALTRSVNSPSTRSAIPKGFKTKIPMHEAFLRAHMDFGGTRRLP